MEHGTTILLVDDYIVYHNQGLSIDIKRVQTLYEHHISYTRCTVAGDGVHLTAQILLNFVLNIDLIGVCEVLGGIVTENVNLLVIFCRECGGVQFDVSLLFTVLQTHADWVEVWHVNVDRSGKLRHL